MITLWLAPQLRNQAISLSLACDGAKSQWKAIGGFARPIKKLPP